MKKIITAVVQILIIVSIALQLSSCKKVETPGTNEVFMKGLAFDPVNITVTKGATVIWTNKESAIHTVTSDISVFDSGDLDKNKTFSFHFTTVGTFPYYCNHHSGMTGKVIVQ